MMLSNVTSQFSACVVQKVVEKLVEDRIAKALIQIIYRSQNSGDVDAYSALLIFRSTHP